MSSSTIDVSNTQTVAEGSEVLVARSEEVSENQERNPNGNSTRRQRRRRCLKFRRIPGMLGRQFVKIGGGVAHAVEHFVDSIPDILENFGN